MFASSTSALDFQMQALVVRAQRQTVLASNIANVDTPGYVGRDLNFKDAMNAAMGSGTALTPATASGTSGDGTSDPRHIALQPTTAELGSNLDYTVQTEPSRDGNSVDLDRERASFADNSIRYEAALRFINGQSKTLLSAIQGQ